MKKVICLMTLALFTSIYAKEAKLTVVRNPPATVIKEWTPLSLTLVTPVALLPGVWDIKGLQFGGFNWAENVTGLQAGLINTADVVKGVQFGAINVSRQILGVQIGFINVIQENDIPFLPIVNWYF